MLNGHKAVVVGAPWASHLIVTARTGGGQRDRDGVSVFLVDKARQGRRHPRLSHRRRPARLRDLSSRMSRVGADALIGPEGAAPAAGRAGGRRGHRGAPAPRPCGVLRKLHEGTLEYTKQRKQFGQPIAAFQVLQHRMVDMFIQRRAGGLDDLHGHTQARRAATPERAKAVSAAKVQIGRACRFVGQNAIQLHGGMGMTDEMAIGHYFKRATMIEGQFGSTDHHLRRYEALKAAAA